MYVGVAAILLLTGVFLGQSNLIDPPFNNGGNFSDSNKPVEEKQVQPTPELIPVTQTNPTVALKKSKDIVYF